jgi:hypothetical protein
MRKLIMSDSPRGGEANLTGAIDPTSEHIFVVQDKSSGA